MTSGTSSEEKNCIYYINLNILPLNYSFGENTKPLPQLPPLKDSIKEALDNRILFYLAIAALLTIATGLGSNPRWGWVEGTSIYIAIFIIVSITSLNDWIKDK